MVTPIPSKIGQEDNLHAEVAAAQAEFAAAQAEFAAAQAKQAAAQAKLTAAQAKGGTPLLPPSLSEATLKIVWKLAGEVDSMVGEKKRGSESLVGEVPHQVDQKPIKEDEYGDALVTAVRAYSSKAKEDGLQWEVKPQHVLNNSDRKTRSGKEKKWASYRVDLQVNNVFFEFKITDHLKTLPNDVKQVKGYERAYKETGEKIQISSLIYFSGKGIETYKVFEHGRLVITMPPKGDTKGGKKALNSFFLYMQANRAVNPEP